MSAIDVVALSATLREYAESTQLLRTSYHSADSSRRERQGQRTRHATIPVAKTLLHVEAELHHVAVLGYVVFAFDPNFADFFGFRPRAELE